MTNFFNKKVDCLNEKETKQSQCHEIEMIIPARTKDLGGFEVRRVMPYMKKRMVGPWIFFDHMGPADFPSGEGINVRPHPHINLATVTYLFEGEIWHRDSLGTSSPVLPGDINLMVAGRGIVHSERTSPELREKGQRLHGLQLWMALPKDDEEIDPAFYHYKNEDIPSLFVGNVPVRVLIGEAYKKSSPVKTFAKTLYLEARMKKGDELELPFSDERALYLAHGELELKGQNIQAYEMAVLSQERKIKIKAVEDSFLALIGGEKFEKRHIFWNFVSSRQDRIEQAKEDWKNQSFPKVPGDDKEFTPLP